MCSVFLVAQHIVSSRMASFLLCASDDSSGSTKTSSPRGFRTGVPDAGGVPVNRTVVCLMRGKLDWTPPRNPDDWPTGREAGHTIGAVR
jgi:hypothetical protein